MEPLPAEGWTFAWWEGDDDCRDSEVVLDRSSKCVAVFALDPDMQRRLHVDIEGSGSVVVNAPPTVSVCRGRCVRQANVGQVVVLRPEPDQARTARFVGFSWCFRLSGR